MATPNLSFDFTLSHIGAMAKSVVASRGTLRRVEDFLPINRSQCRAEPDGKQSFFAEVSEVPGLADGRVVSRGDLPQDGEVCLRSMRDRIKCHHQTRDLAAARRDGSGA